MVVERSMVGGGVVEVMTTEGVERVKPMGASAKLTERLEVTIAKEVTGVVELDVKLEESNIVSDLADPEKKAIEDLKQLIQEALNKHKFTAPPPLPAAPKEEEKKTETEEAPAPAPAEETVAAEEALALVVTEEPPKLETSGVVKLVLASEVVEEKKEGPAPAPEIEASVAAVVIEEVVQKEAEGEAATATPAETKKEEITDTATPPLPPPEEVSIWGVPLLADELRDAILLTFL
ncbi:hypothetical protein NE237_016204 [Protea cynaroides]|uniref:Uncharacterized protein n=1 Tax=Protea cynaroides TaxID=273540 RepID=A0A9Q0KFA6_9MAGN|nr:hypothetical protein NE237_016204 [Protea cynaroides]